MRSTAIVLCLTLAAVTAATAATLETTALVTILPPATVSYAGASAAGASDWRLTGAPGERLQISFELRDATGGRLAVMPAETLALDATGQSLTTLSPLTAPTTPHDPLPIMTLVICRE